MTAKVVAAVVVDILSLTQKEIGASSKKLGTRKLFKFDFDSILGRRDRRWVDKLSKNIIIIL